MDLDKGFPRDEATQAAIVVYSGGKPHLIALNFRLLVGGFSLTANLSPNTRLTRRYRALVERSGDSGSSSSIGTPIQTTVLP